MGCGSSVIDDKDEKKAPVQQPKAAERVVNASLVIQRWFRRYKAHLEMRRRCTWKIFQELEYAEEHDQINLYNFFNEMVDNVNNNDGSWQKFSNILDQNQHEPLAAQESFDSNAMFAADIDNTAISDKYRGLQVTFPLTPNMVVDIVEHFKKGKILHAKFVKKILFQAKLKMKNLPNVVSFNLNISKQITIVGDLHGKIDDLFTLFHKNGLPSQGNPYIFNGDYVDRGEHSLEILLILCCFFLLYPNEVILNRGNHEDYIMNTRYGFTKEITKKYKDNAAKIRALCKDLFGWLPLATVVNGKVFVVHGGISEKTDISKIQAVRRYYFKSVLKPTHVSLEDGKSPSPEIIAEWEQVLDLLWSDPQKQIGKVFNKYRGGGCCFGPDVTQSVLEKHGWELMIRSHECKYEGYEYMHNKKVLTIFSASSYYTDSSNFGAYVKLQVDLKPYIVQFSGASETKNLRLKYKIGVNEKSAINELKEIMYGHKEELIKAFREKDPEHTGFLPICDWSLIMENILQLKLPWKMLSESIAKVDEKKRVNYMVTMKDFKVGTSLDEVSLLSEKIYRKKSTLETVFRIIDKDCSGWISPEEFEEACKVLNKYAGNLVIPENEVHRIATSLDINKDGQIDFNEFLEAFRLVNVSVNGISSRPNTAANDNLPNRKHKKSGDTLPNGNTPGVLEESVSDVLTVKSNTSDEATTLPNGITPEVIEESVSDVLTVKSNASDELTTLPNHDQDGGTSNENSDSQTSVVTFEYKNSETTIESQSNDSVITNDDILPNESDEGEENKAIAKTPLPNQVESLTSTESSSLTTITDDTSARETDF